MRFLISLFLFSANVAAKGWIPDLGNGAINFGKPDGSFHPTVFQSMQGLWGYINVGADMDGDGDIDMIGITVEDYEILLNDGAGKFKFCISKKVVLLKCNNLAAL